MEELNLGDLNFDTDTLQLFDESTGVQEPKADGTTPPSTTVADAAVANVTNNTNTDGEGKDPVDPNLESVADQSKDKNQVQAGEKPIGKEGSDSSSPNLNETEQLYSNLAAEFKAKGILPELDDVSSIKSMKDIEEAIKKSVDSRLTERQKVIEDAQKAGAPITEVSQKVDTIDKLKQVTPEFIRDDNNIEFRKTAIVQDFIEKGYGADRAEAMAQRSIDAGTDVEDAEFALDSLIKSEEAALKIIIDNARAGEKESLNNIKDYIAKTPEVIPGIELTDSQKDELYNQITTDLGNKDNAFMVAQKADPIGSRIKLEALFYLTGGLKDFSIFGNKAESKITNNIENLLRGANFTQEGSVDTNVADGNSNFKLSDLKDLTIE
jgi:predicted nucleic acid-binding OB-fold protein